MNETESLGGQNLALLIWACGAVRQPLPSDQVAALALRTSQQIGRLSMRELSMCVWGLAKMDHLDEDLMDLLAAVLETKLMVSCCPQVIPGSIRPSRALFNPSHLCGRKE